MISQKIFNGVYKGKKVLVTGHTGFQGSWLSLWLKSLGSEVIGYSLKPPTNPSLFKILKMEKEIKHNIGDIRKKHDLEKCMRKYKPQIVFHLAAQPLVRTSYQKPIETFETNVMGTINVLETIKNTPSVRAGIIITSDKCYENKEQDYSYKESDSLGGHDPYSASKGATEIVTSSYRRSFFDLKNNKNNVGIATVRAGNVIGGGDWAQDRIIPDIMKSLFTKKIIKIRNPNSIRPWQHVLEPVSGMLLLGQRVLENPQRYNEAWNFGPRNTSNVNVKDVVKEVLKGWQSGGKWEDVSNKTSKEVHEAKYLKLNSSKALSQLKWHSVYSFKNAINETTTWYWNYYHKKDMREFTIRQIEKYVQTAKDKNLIWSK